MPIFDLAVRAIQFLSSKSGRDAMSLVAGDRAARDRQEASGKAAGMAQLSAEFARARRGFLDDVADALNRLPRPLFALGVFALFAYAFRDPIGFAAMMQGLALVPDPLWAVLGAVITFYFVGRMDHYRRRAKVDTSAAREVAQNIQTLEAMRPAVEVNPALADWQNEGKG